MAKNGVGTSPVEAVRSLKRLAVIEREREYRSAHPKIYSELDTRWRELLDMGFLDVLISDLVKVGLAAEINEMMKPQGRKQSLSHMGVHMQKGNARNLWTKEGSPARLRMVGYLSDTRDGLWVNLYPIAFTVGGHYSSGQLAPLGSAPKVCSDTAEAILQLMQALASFDDLASARTLMKTIAGNFEQYKVERRAAAEAEAAPDEAAGQPCDSAGAGESEVSQLRRELKSLTQEFKSVKAERDGYRNRLSASDKKYSALSKDAQKMEEEIAALKTQLDEASADKAQMAQHAITATKHATEHQTGMQRVVEERDRERARVSKLEAELSAAGYDQQRLQELVQMRDQEISALRGKVERREEVINQIGVSDMLTRINSLSDSLETIGTMKTALVAYQAMVEEQRTEDLRREAEIEAAFEQAERERAAKDRERTEAVAFGRRQRIEDAETALSAPDAPRLVIVDGHNTLLTNWTYDDDGQARGSLLQLLEMAAQRLADRGSDTQFTVVFDTQFDGTAHIAGAGVRVEYAHNQRGADSGTSGADARIMEIILEGNPDERCRVYSSDRKDVWTGVSRIVGEHAIDVEAVPSGDLADYLDDLAVEYELATNLARKIGSWHS